MAINSNYPIYLIQYSYKYGMIISNNATFPNTKLNISFGQVRDSYDVIDIELGGSITTGGLLAPLNGPPTPTPLILDATTNGPNGLDTGTLQASTVYQVFIIADSRYKNPVASLLTIDSNVNAPTMPSGYDSFRSIGYAITDSSSHFLKMFCNGGGVSGTRTLMFDAPQATSVTAGNATTYTGVNLSALVPTFNSNEYCRPVIIQSVYTPALANNQLNLQPSTGTGNPITINGQVTTVPIYSYSTVEATYTSNVVTINYKVSSGSDSVAILVAGFIFG